MNSPFTEDAATRKEYPVFSGVIKYFPRALAEVAHVSWVGNQQHHPEDPLHWDMSKSTDEPDAQVRHMIDGVLSEQETGEPSLTELAKVAWRALANLERACRAAPEPEPKRVCYRYDGPPFSWWTKDKVYYPDAEGSIYDDQGDTVNRDRLAVLVSVNYFVPLLEEVVIYG
jgi:hypothetical protein